MRGTVPKKGRTPSAGRQLSVLALLEKVGKKLSARVSPIAVEEENSTKAGQRVNRQMQKMAENKPNVDDVEDMETEMSPERKRRAGEDS